MLGVVNLDKPVGPTSHDMVGLLRRLTGTRRIGHAGTLDPLASGVLPILVGAATRFSLELTGGDKRYDATIRLGQRSTTDDAEGPIANGGPVPPDADVPAALERFVGVTEQRPPAFSARKQGGRTAHRVARAGAPLDLPFRHVTITRLDLIGSERSPDGSLDLRVDIRCGPGTYVRSLARDLGDALGCGGYLLALRRTEAAGLVVANAITPAELEVLAADGRLADALQPVETVLRLPVLTLDPAEAWRFAHGGSVPLASDASAQGRHAVFGDGALLGVGTVAGGTLQPERVIAVARAPE